MPGSSKLATRVQAARSAKRKLLAIYLTAGYPEPSWTVPIGRAVFDAGADLLELGMPHSDPLADGPVIQAASSRALRAGCTLDVLFDCARELSDFGCVLYMGYLNGILARAKEFPTRAADSGLEAVIIPDWPVHDAVEQALSQSLVNAGLSRIPFVAPTSSIERVREIDSLRAPFVYAVSIAGVTGTRQLDQSVEAYLCGLRATLSSPYLAGFGVSDPDSARRLADASDGVIVGSALLKLLSEAKGAREAAARAGEFVKNLRDAIDVRN